MTVRVSRILLLLLSPLALSSISACDSDSPTTPASEALTIPPRSAWTQRVYDVDLAPDLYVVYDDGVYRAGGDDGVDMEGRGGEYWWLHRTAGTERLIGFADMNIDAPVVFHTVKIYSGGVIRCDECPGLTEADYGWEFAAIAERIHDAVVVGESGHVLTYNGSTVTEHQTAVTADFTDVIDTYARYLASWSYLASCSDGTIRKSSDGVNWTVLGDTGAGRLRALAAHDDAIVALGSDGQPVSSIDGGATWKVDHRFTGLLDVTYIGRKFVAVGEDGLALLSSDVFPAPPDTLSDAPDPVLPDWQRVRTGTRATLRSVAGNSPIIAVGDGAAIIASDDGRSWERHQPGRTQRFMEVLWTGEQFVAAAGPRYTPDLFASQPLSSPVYTSRDGITWSRENAVEDAGSIWGFQGLGRSGTRTVASATTLAADGSPRHGRVYVSDDLYNWRVVHDAVNSEYAKEVFVLKGNFYVICTNEVLRSPDGETWTSLPKTTYGRLINFSSVTVRDEVAYGMQWDGALETSTNLIQWQSVGSVGHPGTLKSDISLTGDGFLVTGYTNGGFEGRIWWSPDGVLWLSIGPKTEHIFFGAAASEDRWVVVGDNGAIFTRENRPGPF